MIFTKSRKNTKDAQVVMIFFQTPSDAALSKISRYLDANNHICPGYFGQIFNHSSFEQLGFIPDFPSYITSNSVCEIMIVGNPTPGGITHEMLLALKFSGAKIKMIPLHFDLLSGLVEMDHNADIPHIKLYPNKKTAPDKLAKFILDKFIGFIGLAITAILFPFIALAIKTGSKGPVIYTQKRLGKYGRPFKLYKFRTMYQSAEINGPQLSNNNDHRITREGKILRYWHIDELLQFWNILKGDMSLVGPRPERPYFARFLAKQIPYYKIIYQEKPGLTSLGMINYGYASSVEEMTDRLYYDIVYLNNPSFLSDVKILGRTLWYLIKKTFVRPSEERKNITEARLDNIEPVQDPLVRWLSLKSKATK